MSLYDSKSISENEKLFYPFGTFVTRDPISSIRAIFIIVHVDLMAEVAILSFFPAILTHLADHFSVQLGFAPERWVRRICLAISIKANACSSASGAVIR